MALNAFIHLSLLFLLLELVTSESVLLPDANPPLCPAIPKTELGVDLGQLDPADNLESILVVDADVPMFCQHLGSDNLTPGQWVVSSLSTGDVYDYGQVLRRQGRLSFFGFEMPTFMRPRQARRIVLPSMSDVLALPAGQLGARVGRYSVILDRNKPHQPTEHIFTARPGSGERNDFFRGATPPTPLLWLPELITEPSFIAPMAAGVERAAVVKGYRIWGHMEPQASGTCDKDRYGDPLPAVDVDNRPTVHYRALFLLYGRGNAVRGGDDQWTLPPVCKGSGNPIATGARRAGRSPNLAFRAQHRSRPAL
ncbi:MAG: hypothetical protein M1826_005425 [Phylliscum demangeonii]|nr:MAG: hypothetical protein M1826_005425 [Phylliscum demangeonii]